MRPRPKLLSAVALTTVGLPILLLVAFASLGPRTAPPAPTPDGNISPQTISTGTITDSSPSNRSRTTPEPAPQPTAATPSATPVVAASMTAPKPTDKFFTANNKQYPLRTYKLMSVPNDPAASQWWVSNTKLDQMWDIPAGSHQTVLAIIDTGFALGHEEFSNRWYTNPGEAGAAANNGIDDDGNGFVDDVHGWDFTGDDNSPQAGETDPAGSGTTHGTRVAGVAAATGNNGKGIAGVDWQAKILPIQALDDGGHGNTWGVGQAIYYATEMGADVISLSLGSDLPDDYVREAVQAATAAGIVVVAASGNDGCECMVYPANYPEVVAVGALDTNNQPADFNSYGANLDILAPGTQITSASWTAANPTNAYVSNSAGTSFATPLVSGLLSRMLSTEPDATPLQLIAALTEDTDRLSLPANISRSPTLGYGGTNAYKAAARMVTPHNTSMLYKFTPVSTGAYLTPSAPTEAAGTYAVQKCEDGQVGTTPIYELYKANSDFLTVSQVEVWQAQKAGYQAALFAEACLQQPHDTASFARSLNIFKEFRNIYTHSATP